MGNLGREIIRDEQAAQARDNAAERYTREQLEPDELVLKCMIPVYVVMDGETVRKVVVDDEALDLSKAELFEHSAVTGDAALEAARLQHAVAMSEDSYWPSWEFGW